MYLPEIPAGDGGRIARDPDLSDRRFEVTGFSYRAAGPDLWKLSKDRLAAYNDQFDIVSNCAACTNEMLRSLAVFVDPPDTLKDTQISKR